jgi:hypothetical protein
MGLMAPRPPRQSYKQKRNIVNRSYRGELLASAPSVRPICHASPAPWPLGGKPKAAALRKLRRLCETEVDKLRKGFALPTANSTSPTIATPCGLLTPSIQPLGTETFISAPASQAGQDRFIRAVAGLSSHLGHPLTAGGRLQRGSVARQAERMILGSVSSRPGRLDLFRIPMMSSIPTIQVRGVQSS